MLLVSIPVNNNYNFRLRSCLISNLSESGKVPLYPSSKRQIYVRKIPVFVKILLIRSAGEQTTELGTKVDNSTQLIEVQENETTVPQGNLGSRADGEAGCSEGPLNVSVQQPSLYGQRVRAARNEIVYHNPRP
jgi:hypothetical protein